MKPPSGFSPSTHQGNANTNLKSSFDERYVLGNLENFIKMLPIIKGNFSLILSNIIVPQTEYTSSWLLEFHLPSFLSLILRLLRFWLKTGQKE